MRAKTLLPLLLTGICAPVAYGQVWGPGVALTLSWSPAPPVSLTSGQWISINCTTVDSDRAAAGNPVQYEDIPNLNHAVTFDTPEGITFTFGAIGAQGWTQQEYNANTGTIIWQCLGQALEIEPGTSEQTILRVKGFDTTHVQDKRHDPDVFISRQIMVTGPPIQPGGGGSGGGS